jgi:hypothetical protein
VPGWPEKGLLRYGGQLSWKAVLAHHTGAERVRFFRDFLRSTRKNEAVFNGETNVMLKDMSYKELLEALNDEELTPRRRVAIAKLMLTIEAERERVVASAKEAGLRWPPRRKIKWVS